MLGCILLIPLASYQQVCESKLILYLRKKNQQTKSAGIFLDNKVTYQHAVPPKTTVNDEFCDKTYQESIVNW